MGCGCSNFNGKYKNASGTPYNDPVSGTTHRTAPPYRPPIDPRGFRTAAPTIYRPWDPLRTSSKVGTAKADGNLPAPPNMVVTGRSGGDAWGPTWVGYYKPASSGYASATGSYPPGVSWPPARTKPWEPDNLTTHRTASPFRPPIYPPYRTARPSDWDLIRRTARPTGGVDDTLYRTAGPGPEGGPTFPPVPTTLGVCQGADCPGFDDLRLGFGGRKSGGRRYKSFNG